jgi:uroporphyrinogen-III synthase
MRGSGLVGRRVAVTRPGDGPGADPLASLLEHAGARVLHAPLIRIVPPADPAPLLAAAASVRDYEWVVFTSATAVRALGGCAGFSPRDTPGRVAAVGAATAAAVQGVLGWSVDAVPDEFTGDRLVKAMEDVAVVRGTRVLWPRAEAARDTLALDLTRAGALLDQPVAYRTLTDPAAAADLADLARRGAVDALIFTSPSAIRCFAAASGQAGGACIAVIGPTTAAAARGHGLPVHVEPVQHTFPMLVQALNTYFSATGPPRG